MSEMTPFKLLISREKALEIILNSIMPMERTELIHIEKSSNRVLVEESVADKDVPPFDRAAMDGYAIRAEDTYGASQAEPKTLKLVGIIHAGESTNISIKRGECIRISTGCPIPSFADAVVMVEFAEETDATVSIFTATYPGANIAPRGEDIKKGEVVLKERESLNPAKIGILAALGQKKVLVYQKPRIAIIPTGKEICEIGSELRKGQIYDINSYALSSLLSENGALVTISPIIQDSFEQLKSALQRFLDHDIIVFSGGSSVGERDLLVKVIENIGKILFHGVQIKPGKPTLFGLIEKTPIFGMPGNPTSCLSNAYIFLIPAIQQITRLPVKEPRTIKAKMAKRIVSASGREQFLTVKLIDKKVYPAYKESGDITSMAKADGYIILPVNLDVIEEEEEVIVTLFE